jgi:hypothetical protein
MPDFKQLYKKIKGKLHRKSLDVQLYATYLKRKATNSLAQPESNRPAVWIDLAGNSYVRFSYLLFKYFEIEGYQVYYKPNLKFMLSLGAPYARLLIMENKALFSNKKPANAVEAFSDNDPSVKKSISNDYFSNILKNEPRAYYIPIGMHPNMYKLGLWNAEVPRNEVKKSIFFAGNFNEAVYKRISKNRKFHMTDRVEIGKMLKTLPNCNFPKSYEELINNHKDGNIDIVQQANFGVPMEKLRSTIARYTYFIACPGVDMPHSHNLIEAMSVSGIPIIHVDYGNMMSPPLEDNKNAIFYTNDNFIEKLKEALALDDAIIAELSRNATLYYDQHLTPKGIVREMLSPDYDKYYLNAERTSVGIMKV